MSNNAGKQQFCPLYVSLDGEIPSVTLTISVIESQQEIWIESSWSGSETLGRYRIGTDSCTTIFGKKLLIDAAFPESFGGSKEPFPIMDKKT